MVAVHVVVAALIGAAYAFAPAVMGDIEDSKLAFVALAFVATISGIPVMAMWVNGRVLWGFSKLLDI